MDMTPVRAIAKSYVDKWRAHHSMPGHEDQRHIHHDLGWEDLQLFKNYPITAFDHSEMAEVVFILTETLAGQWNFDHDELWRWCQLTATVASRLQIGPRLRHDWYHPFSCLIRLLNRPADWHETVLTVAPPLTYALLEGLLRRLNPRFVNIDGKVTSQFSIYKVGKRCNSVEGLLQFHVTNRANIGHGRIVSMFQALNLQNGQTPNWPFGLIGEWRNEFLHGKDYWEDRFPLIMNIICLLLISEFDSSSYEKSRDQASQLLVHGWENAIKMSGY